MRQFASLLFAVVCVAACGGDEETAQVGGDYTVNVVNAENTCNLQPWVQNPISNIGVTVVQTGEAVRLTVDGVAGVLVSTQLGGNDFTGEVAGSDIELQRLGSVARSQGNCAYTYNAAIEASLDGDTLAGEIRYQAATNGNPDCGALTNCVSVQKFNGTRPPQ